MSLGPSASDSPGTLEVKFLSPSAKAESPRQPTVIQRNSDDKLEFSFLSRIDQIVSNQNGARQIDDLQWKTQTRHFKEFSSAENRCTSDFNVRVDLKDVHRHFFFVQCPLSLLQVSFTVDNDPL